MIAVGGALTHRRRAGGSASFCGLRAAGRLLANLVVGGKRAQPHVAAVGSCSRSRQAAPASGANKRRQQAARQQASVYMHSRAPADRQRFAILEHARARTRELQKHARGLFVDCLLCFTSCSSARERMRAQAAARFARRSVERVFRARHQDSFGRDKASPSATKTRFFYRARRPNRRCAATAATAATAVAAAAT